MEAARLETPLTYFEYGNLAALWLFARERVEAAGQGDERPRAARDPDHRGRAVALDHGHRPPARRRRERHAAVREAGESATTERLIRLGLKQLAR